MTRSNSDVKEVTEEPHVVTSCAADGNGDVVYAKRQRIGRTVIFSGAYRSSVMFCTRSFRVFKAAI